MQNVFKSTLQHFVTSALFVIVLFSSASFAAPLKVGTYPCPPFVIHSTGEELSGLSVELWERIAKNMG
ncbi:MAG: ABC transporter substrate-binding protein, partial [Pseudomonadota bacterium]